MEEQQIVCGEVEKLFGQPKRVDLFDESDDYYNVIRPYILLQPAESYKKKVLPFSGIELPPYVDYMRQLAIEDANKQKYHVFYIKKGTKGNVNYCDAAGYYQPSNKTFVILKYSYIISTNNYSFNDLALQLQRRKAMMSKSKTENDNRYLTDNIVLQNPIMSASFVLGTKASTIEWVDEKGRSILSFYPSLSQLQAQLQPPEPPIIVKNKPVTIPKEKKEAILGIVMGLLKTKEEKDKNRQLFSVEEKGVCKAFGYYEPESGYFYVCKDSLVARYVDREYSYTPSGEARVRFIDKACVAEGKYFRVTKDAKCRNATAAASYVLGRTATYVEWIDVHGRGLNHYYPSRFYQSKDTNRKNVQQRSSVTGTKANTSQRHMFFIKKNLGVLRNCDARGYYDPITKKFLLLEGSLLSIEVTSTYRYTASEILRKLFIKKNCIKLSSGFRLKKDALLDSPSTASSYVLGRNSNGGIDWSDSEGTMLRDIYDIK